MKKIIVITTLILLSTAAFAETVIFEAKNGNVSFDHEKHQSQLNNCSLCHNGEPDKLELTKKMAHDLCKSCHKETTGPTKCSGCHVKE